MGTFTHSCDVRYLEPSSHACWTLPPRALLALLSTLPAVELAAQQTLAPTSRNNKTAPSLQCETKRHQKTAHRASTHTQTHKQEDGRGRQKHTRTRTLRSFSSFSRLASVTCLESVALNSSRLRCSASFAACSSIVWQIHTCNSDSGDETPAAEQCQAAALCWRHMHLIEWQ